MQNRKAIKQSMGSGLSFTDKLLSNQWNLVSPEWPLRDSYGKFAVSANEEDRRRACFPETRRQNRFKTRSILLCKTSVP